MNESEVHTYRRTGWDWVAVVVVMVVVYRHVVTNIGVNLLVRMHNNTYY